MNITVFFIRYPRTLAIALVTLLAWAVASALTLPRQESPVLTWRMANVITRLPGASAERVEALISDVLEKRVAEVDGVEHVYSVSRAGLSLVQVELSDEVTEAEPVWQKVRQKLTEATDTLPEGVIGPELDDEIAGAFAALIAVTGEAQSFRELKDYAQRLEEELRWLPTTASTSLFGVQPEVVEVRVDPSTLAAHSLSFRQLASALEGRNVRRPAGRLRTRSDELVIEVSGEWADEREIADTLLPATPDGRTIKVRDVATVVRTERSPPEPLARANGKRAVVVGARGRQDIRIDEYGARIGEVVERFAETLPAGVGVAVLNDLGRYTRERERDLAWTAVWSIIGVFLSTALFMNVRACAIVAAAIPVTIGIVLVVFSLIGIPLNEMSAMAMIMAMGLLVDNAILVTEQIDRRMSQGTAADVAAAEEPARLFAPLVVSTLTTAVAFVPIYLLPGGVGEFVRAIPVGVAFSLLVSLGVAMTVTPTLCALFWRFGGSDADHRPAIPAMAGVYAWIEARFFALIEHAIARPGLTVAIALAVTASCASLGLVLRRDFFSPVQRDQFIVDVYTHEGASLEHTASVVGEIEAILLADDKITSVGSFIGRNAPLVFYNLLSQETYAPHFAQIVVQVSDWSETARTAQRIQATLNREIVGAESCARILEHGAPLLAPFEVRISGPSIETLTEIGRRTVDILRATPGARNIRSNFGSEAVKLVAEVNEPVARSLGIDERTVAEELAARLDGAPAGFVREGDERIDVTLRYPVLRRGGSPNLNSVYFKPTPDAGLMPLASVATLMPVWEPAGIHRRDGRRTLTVLGYPDFGLTAAQVAGRFKDELASLADSLPEGYSLSLGGENEQRNEAEWNLLLGGVYAFWIIVLLIFAEFRSFRLTAIIGAVIVLSISGGLVALWITGWPLNFMAMMGMIMHAGVAENDAVVLIDALERRRRAGEPLNELILAGTRERIRHVLITSTSIGGYLPLAMSDSLLWPPLAIVMIGGLALSTLLTLIVVPAAYRLVWRG